MATAPPRHPGSKVLQADPRCSCAALSRVILPGRRPRPALRADRDVVALLVELVRALAQSRSNTSVQVCTSPGWATQEPSKPASASRVLSARVFASAAAVASGSALLGTNAAIPPIAWAPRAWQVLTSSSVYARMKGNVMVIWSGRAAVAVLSAKFLIIEKM